MSKGTFFASSSCSHTSMMHVPCINDAMVHHVSMYPRGYLQQMKPAVKCGTIVVVAEHFRSCHRGRGRAAFMFTTCQDRLKTFKQDLAEDYRQISGVLSENLKHF